MYHLAYNLGMSVADVEEMPAEEVKGWLEYFERYPPGWREDSRFALLIQYIAGIVGGKVKPEELFGSLKQMRSVERNRLLRQAEEGRPDVKGFLQSIFALKAKEDGDDRDTHTPEPEQDHGSS